MNSSCARWPPRPRHDPPSWRARRAAVVRHLNHPTPKQVITGTLFLAQRCWSICPLIIPNENPGDLTWEYPSWKVYRWDLFWAGVLPALRPVPPLTRGFASTSQRRHHRICLQGRLGGGYHAVFLFDAQMDSCAACNGGRKTGKGIGDTIWRVNHPGPRPP